VVPLPDNLHVINTCDAFPSPKVESAGFCVPLVTHANGTVVTDAGAGWLVPNQCENTNFDSAGGRLRNVVFPRSVYGVQHGTVEPDHRHRREFQF
jgi:hypothetical protein